jgi:hypothetical protein
MPFRELETEFTPIDADPHFARVIRYMRAEDWGTWALATIATPAGYYYWEMKRPVGALPIGLKGAAAVGFFGGFFLAYQSSSCKSPLYY